MHFQVIKIVIVLWLNFEISKCCLINETHAVILARGGSKGIKNKNLLRFNGTTLLGNTIRTIRKSQKFNNIWVSTDDEAIRQEAVIHGALTYMRMTTFAQDGSTSIDAVKEFLYKNPLIKRFALFQCTSVFLKTEYIEEAVNKFRDYPCVFAVKRSHKLRWKQLDHSNIAPLNFSPMNRPRRQDWEGELEEVGMFYFSNRKLVSRNILQDERCSVVVIKAEDSIEIDSLTDFKIAQCISEATQFS